MITAPRIIYARLTEQGTAATETAVCGEHLAFSLPADDTVGEPVACPDNVMLSCVICGARNLPDTEPLPLEFPGVQFEVSWHATEEILRRAAELYEPSTDRLTLRQSVCVLFHEDIEFLLRRLDGLWLTVEPGFWDAGREEQP